MADENVKRDGEMTVKNGSKVSANEGNLNPIIIDLGKKKRKQVRKLCRGKPGALMDKIQEVLLHTYQAEAIPAGAQPVVVVVREKPRRRVSKGWGLG